MPCATKRRRPANNNQLPLRASILTQRYI